MHLSYIIYSSEGRNTEYQELQVTGSVKGICPQPQIPGTDLPSKMCVCGHLGERAILFSLMRMP